MLYYIYTHDWEFDVSPKVEVKHFALGLHAEQFTTCGQACCQSLLPQVGQGTGAGESVVRVRVKQAAEAVSFFKTIRLSPVL